VTLDFTPRQQRFQSVAAQRQSGLVLVLEDIGDPHNAGAILRTCDAFGIQSVHFVFDQQPGFNPKKKASATATAVVKWLSIHTHDSTAAALAFLKAQSYQMVATTLTDATPLYDTDWGHHPRLALWVGNEHRGLSHQAIQSADFRVTIPMRGMAQSLNVSVTAALVMAEITRQRVASGIPFDYDANAQQALVASFDAIDAGEGTFSVPDRPFLGVFGS